MANPQRENGHVDIANEIIEQLARVNLSSYEWRVLMIVLRKTWGWNKKLDRIAVSQIANMTGLWKQHASRARISLIEKKILVEQNGKTGFNKDYETWEVRGSRVASRGDEIVTGIGDGVTDTGYGGVTNLGDGVTGIGYKSSPAEALQKTINTLTKDKVAEKDKTHTFVLKNKKLWHLPQAKLDEYTEAFPKLDVDAEFRKAAQWLNDNPDRRKTAKGMTRFLGNWLGRAKPGASRGDPDWLPTEEEAEELLQEVEA